MQVGHVTRSTAFIADSLLVDAVLVSRFEEADLLTELARNLDFLMRKAAGTSSDWYAASARYMPLKDSSPPHNPIASQHKTSTYSTSNLNLFIISTDSCTLLFHLPQMVASAPAYLLPLAASVQRFTGSCSNRIAPERMR
jgi:hypothetical protein